MFTRRESKYPSVLPTPSGWFKIFLLLLLAFVIATGYLLAQLRATAVDKAFRNQLIRQAGEVASLIPYTLAANLTFSPEDATSDSFIKISEIITSYGNSVPNRGIYTLTLRNQQFIFGPENYSPDDPMASPPGTPYVKVPPNYRNLYLKGQPWVEGPVTDEYGTFVSAFAPVKDPRSGDIIMVIGIDILAEDWNLMLQQAKRPPLIGAAILIMLMLLGITALAARNRLSSGKNRGRHLETLLALVYGLSITAGASWWVRDSELREKQTVFNHLAELQGRQLSDAFQAITEGIQLAAAFMHASAPVRSDDFQLFTRPILQHLYLEAIGWAPFLREDTLPDLPYWLSQKGLPPLPPPPGHALRLQPDPQSPLLLPVLFSAPPDLSPSRYGWDLTSDPRMQTAILRSLHRGDAQAIPLDPHDTTETDIQYIIFQRVAPIEAADHSHENQGIVFAIVRLHSILERVLAGFSRDAPLLAIKIKDISPDALSQHHASHALPYAAHRHLSPRAETFERPLIAMGRTFNLHIQPTERFYQVYTPLASRLTLITGTIATLILAAFIGFIRERHIDLERQILRRTADLREREQNLSITLNAIGDAVIVTDTLGNIQRMNPVAEKLTGWTFNESRNQSCHNILKFEKQPDGINITPSFETTLENAFPDDLDHDITLHNRNGDHIHVDISAATIHDPDGHRLGSIIVFRDISETVNHRLSLEQSERRYRQLFSEMASGFALHEVILDDHGAPCNTRLIEANEAFTRLTGLQDIVGKTLLEILPETEPFWIETFSRVALTGESTRFEQESRALGKHFDVNVYSPEPRKCAVIFSDITTRREAELALAHREAFQRLLVKLAAQFVNISPDQLDAATEEGLADIGIFARVDRAYQFTYDTRHLSMTNTHEWCAGDIAPFIHTLQNIPTSNFKEMVQAHLAAEPYYLPDLNQLPTDHPMRPSLIEQGIQSLVTIPMINDGACIGFIGFDSVRNTRTWSQDEIALLQVMANLLVNARNRKQSEESRLTLERQILQAQKLESIGVLAGGIAHDFNNILTGILGNADLTLRDIPPSSPLRPNLDAIIVGSRRAADLCRQMLAYAGKGRFVIETFQLNDLIREMVHLLQTSISKRALLNLQLEPNLPPIRGDASQIRQILLNLVINASEAIEDKSGTISITSGATLCRRHELDALSPDLRLKEGVYATLQVTDTGCGMTPETLSRIFEPFFTTKFTGRGLGLAAVLGIVKGHHGALRVTSKVNQGTSFTLYFPISDQPAETNPAPSTTEAPAKPSTRQGTILLVDDEESIRVIGSRMLERIGYTVLLAADGREGVEVFTPNRHRIDAVILDLTMPHLNGEQAFKAIREIDQSVPVIMASGYSKDELSERLGITGLSAFIQKPYTTDALREVLDTILPPPIA
ncbi:MAG TPA: ATP-binding protein [Kiritimatiellia bacterium]|nr:ATP-binding protein [Kiritimatiellia bacterium]